MAKQVSKAATRRVAAAPHLQIAHRIEALLRTMRVIEQHEEQLCVVMTEIRSAAKVTAETLEELKVLLEELPGEAYQADLDAVGRALATIDARRKAVPVQSGGKKKRGSVKTKAQR